MFWVAATSFFALLALGNIAFALRSEEKRAMSWLIAIAATLVCGISFGNFVQDGRLTARIDLLVRETERLKEDNLVLSNQLRRETSSDVGLPIVQSAQDTPPDQTNETGAARDPVETPASLPSTPFANSPVSGTPETGGATEPNTTQPESETAQIEVADASGGAASTSAEVIPETSSEPGLDTGGLEEPSQAISGSVLGGATATPPNQGALDETFETVGETNALTLSGIWEMQTTIEETSYPSFLGTELTFRLDLRQEGGRLQAEGEKLSERAVGATVREYSPGSRTPIVLAGEFLGENLVQFAFEEQGTTRSSGGDMLLMVVSPTRLEGSFSSSAAGSAGRVVFWKLAE